MKSLRHVLAVGLIGLGLVGCGGGGAGNGTSGNGMASNTVRSATTTTVQAGQSIPVSAKAAIRGGPISSMQWTVAPLFAASGKGIPLFSDAACATATLTPAKISGASAEGDCQAVLTLPQTVSPGVWRVSNTAKAADGTSVTGSFDLTVNTTGASGFALIEQMVPMSGYVNKLITLSAPFTVKPGVTVSNVRYVWEPATGNPANVLLAGAKSSTPSFVTSASGQYLFNVTAIAEVDGMTQASTTSMVVIVSSAPGSINVTAGDVQVVATNSVVHLFGSILNKSANATYTTKWEQLTGPAGGPVAVSISNANTEFGSFVPTQPGTYGFQFTATQSNPDGTLVSASATTSVVVDGSPTPVFSLSAGDSQIVKADTVATLRGSVSGQSSSPATYSWAWSQTSGPTTVSIANANAATATVIPTAAGVYSFELTLTAYLASGTTVVKSSTQVSVLGSSPSTFAMSVNAGGAQSVAPNTAVTLPGTVSTQGESVGVKYSYEWTQIGASPATVQISNASSAYASILPTVAGSYTFQLTVKATTASGAITVASAQTQVVVTGNGAFAFSVSAGNAQTIKVNNAAAMEGSVSTQGATSGITYTYSWVQVGASPAAVTVSNANALKSSFVATAAGTYTFELTVSATYNGVTTTKTAQTQVLVTP